MLGCIIAHRVLEQGTVLVQPVIAIERIVYHRERAAGMYAAMPYALAQGDVEIPYLLVQALLWSVITYWMFGFEASAGATLCLLQYISTGSILKMLGKLLLNQLYPSKAIQQIQRGSLSVSVNKCRPRPFGIAIAV